EYSSCLERTRSASVQQKQSRAGALHKYLHASNLGKHRSRLRAYEFPRPPKTDAPPNAFLLQEGRLWKPVESYRRFLVTEGSGGSGLSLRSDDLPRFRQRTFPLPEGSLSVLVGRHGAMNPAGRVRCNIMPIGKGYSRASQPFYRASQATMMYFVRKLRFK